MLFLLFLAINCNSIKNIHFHQLLNDKMKLILHAVFWNFVDCTKSQLQKTTNNNQHNILKMTSSCVWRHHACDVIICGDFIRGVFEITKVQTENSISQQLDKFACFYKDLLVLMTSSSFSLRHSLKIII